MTLQCDISQIPFLELALNRVKEYAQEHPEKQWILGTCSSLQWSAWALVRPYALLFSVIILANDSIELRKIIIIIIIDVIIIDPPEPTCSSFYFLPTPIQIFIYLQTNKQTNSNYHSRTRKGQGWILPWFEDGNPKASLLVSTAKGHH